MGFHAEVDPAGGSLTVPESAGLRKLVESGDRSKWYEAEGSRRCLPHFDWALWRVERRCGGWSVPSLQSLEMILDRFLPSPQKCQNVVLEPIAVASHAGAALCERLTWMELQY